MANKNSEARSHDAHPDALVGVVNGCLVEEVTLAALDLLSPSHSALVTQRPAGLRGQDATGRDGS